jgi:hypothetical protein
MVLDGLYLRMVCFHKRTSHFEMKMNGFVFHKKTISLCNVILESMHVCMDCVL